METMKMKSNPMTGILLKRPIRLRVGKEDKLVAPAELRALQRRRRDVIPMFLEAESALIDACISFTINNAMIADQGEMAEQC